MNWWAVGGAAVLAAVVLAGLVATPWRRDPDLPASEWWAGVGSAVFIGGVTVVGLVAAVGVPDPVVSALGGIWFAASVVFGGGYLWTKGRDGRQARRLTGRRRPPLHPLLAVLLCYVAGGGAMVVVVTVVAAWWGTGRIDDMAARLSMMTLLGITLAVGVAQWFRRRRHFSNERERERRELGLPPSEHDRPRRWSA